MQKKQQANESISQLANKFEKEIKTTPSQCATVKALATRGWRGQVLLTVAFSVGWGGGWMTNLKIQWIWIPIAIRRNQNNSLSVGEGRGEAENNNLKTRISIE